MKRLIIIAFVSATCILATTAYGAKNNLEKKPMTPKKSYKQQDARN